MTDFTGTIGNDRFLGSEDGDSFLIDQGGADIVKGYGGDDVIRAGAAFGADDQINGGDGDDVLMLDGDYSAGVVFGARTLVGVERIEYTAGHDYDLTLSDRAAGGSSNPEGPILSISGIELGVDDHIRIDASALQDDHRIEFLASGLATSVIIGGAGNDVLTFAEGGRFDVSGGGGNDTVALYRQMTQADHFDGGAGEDTLVVFTDQNVAFSGAMLHDVETLYVYGDSFTIDMRDTAVAAGAQMLIYAEFLEAGQHLDFDGSRERDGVFTVTGGADSDVLVCGRGDDSVSAGFGDDRITGGSGADSLFGEAGSDTFVYLTLGDSGHQGRFDLIIDLEDADIIDLSAIDAKADKAGDQAFHIVAGFGGHAGELVLTYDADSDLTTLAVDVNGDARADMAVQMTGDHQGFAGFVL